MSPFGPFYCVFKWDLSRLEDSNFKASETVVVRPAKESEMLSVAEVWHRGLLECKSEGLRRAEVETIARITASEHLYPKFGGIEQRVPA